MISTVLRTLAVGRREWIPSCLASLHISLETDENGGTSSGYFVTGLVSSTIRYSRGVVGPGSKCTWRAWRSGSPDRRETDKALYMSLATVCKNEALNVVKTVTHKRGFESWRKLSKDDGATTGTSLHKYTNLLEYDFGTTDGFKKRLLKWENQIVDFQKATSEVFIDRLKCATVLSRSPAPIRTYLRVQNRGDYGALRVALMNYLEAEDDGHGPVPMEVGAVKGKKGDKGKKGYGKVAKVWECMTRSIEYSKNNEYGKGNKKGKERGKKGKGKG